MTKKPPPGAGDSGLAEALLDELGDDGSPDALVYDEAGNPISPVAKERSREGLQGEAYRLKRNDIETALKLLRELAVCGPVKPELLEQLAMLQDDPGAFLRLAKERVSYIVERAAWDR